MKRRENVIQASPFGVVWACVQPLTGLYCLRCTAAIRTVSRSVLTHPCRSIVRQYGTVRSC